MEFINNIINLLEGKGGWIKEALTILVMVILFNFVIKSLLKRLHFRFERQSKPWKDSFVRALYKPLSYLIWIIALVYTTNIISTKFLGYLIFDNARFIISVAAVLAISWFLLRWKKNVVIFMINKSKKNEIAMDPGKVDAIGKLVTVIIIFFALLWLLETSDHSMNTLIAFGGVGGLAIAFASQEIIANFFGGFMIYLNQPFAIGDWILLIDSKIEGNVEDIGWYMTRIRTFDKRPIYVPNSLFSKTIVMNPTRMTHRQIKEIIGIRYRDMPVMREIVIDIRKMLEKHHDIDHNQRIIVNFSNFGSYALEITVDAYAKSLETATFYEVKEDVLLKIADILIKHKADMAYPTSVVEVPDGIAIKQ